MRFNLHQFLDTFPWAMTPCQVIDQSDVYFGYHIDNVFEFDTDEWYVKVLCVDEDGKICRHPDWSGYGPIQLSTFA